MYIRVDILGRQHWRCSVDAKGNDSLTPSRVIVDAKKRRPCNVFLLIGVRKGIQQVKLRKRLKKVMEAMD